MSITSLEKLDAWCKAKAFSLRVYREVLPFLPPEEKWNLSQQLRRSSLSIPANIAEGFGRYYYQDNIRFCYNARGSLQETLSHLEIACEMKFISKPIINSIEQDGEELTKLINGYIGYLKKSKHGFNEPGSNQMVHESTTPYEADIQNNGSRSSNNDSRIPNDD